ncbi:MAG: cytochrome c4 [Burkholderiales bacterium]|nr:cytochrome c4 [Burkholderiales bacterium]
MIRLWAVAAGLAFACATLAFAQAPAKPDPAKGQAIATQVCAACHGADGNSPTSANPHLAGQIPEYLYRQMVAFKSQGGKKPERENAVMTGMVAPLSDADMRNLAAYYAAQKLKPAAARDKDLAALGQKIYRGGNVASGVPACAGCHGPTGAGIPSQYPRIAGQYPEYIEAQLKAFRAGTRANDPNGMMRGAAARLTDQEIRALAEYVAGLR